MADGSHHPYGGYNKVSQTSETLVGNWVEERALEAATGTHRYKSWVEPVSDTTFEDGVYAKKVGAPDFIPTAPRVIEHSNKTESEEWMTHSQDVHRHPEMRNGDLRVHKNISGPGKRTTMMLEAMKKEACQLPGDAPLTHDLATTTGTTYVKHGMEDQEVGLRVMKTQDGLPRTLDNRDPVFLAESGIQHKSRVDREHMGAVDGSHLGSAVPVTVYQESVEGAAYPGQGFVHGTAHKGANPFAKTCNFTKPMADHTKVVVDE
mmetsp:Transcript_18086/g.21653  ORF Transcript_18086/g.21653 Transcript_18086/m.21653 type:complete len:262 (-) Transcript_18086:546-1331(-)|eukprot:CAMPEP_0197847748 /NCGR_PEP_ID=MMETSP1438-20131217/6951_1 /TAXON_ID=1461541 /ORGANISM="Pterosperma sp., Strain CCMP1384" /LENGTH=261 /DNA_ID=CAMNT_0043459759 /DNA_START=64 /DNA_END=849 /DNA_ORIENTATION=+